jgi:hypothetical protein
MLAICCSALVQALPQTDNLWTNHARRYARVVFDDLDELDHELLSHFGARFPRPASIGFCDYDVRPEDAAKLCTDPRLYANKDLIWTFVRHNRLGMFGDWRDFPAFVGDLAVFCRREPMMMEGDHGFFFLHLSEHGAFDDEDRALLRRWVEDILTPWQRPLRRGLLHWCKQECSYLGLFIELGGDVHEVLARNLERSRFVELTKLARALSDPLLTEQAVREHFDWLMFTDNQTLPIRRYVRPTLVDEVWRAIRTFMDSVTAKPDEPIDEDALHEQLYSEDPTLIEQALLSLEAARWHHQEFVWRGAQPFPEVNFEAFEVVPSRLVEAYLSIATDYASDENDFTEPWWSHMQAVFVHGDGRAAPALAACVLGDVCPNIPVKDLMLGMWDALGEPDHPCRSTRVAGARELMRRLLGSGDWLTRRECVFKMGLWDGDLRTEVAEPLLELLSFEERTSVEESWAENDEP